MELRTSTWEANSPVYGFLVSVYTQTNYYYIYIHARCVEIFGIAQTVSIAMQNYPNRPFVFVLSPTLLPYTKHDHLCLI